MANNSNDNWMRKEIIIPILISIITAASAPWWISNLLRDRNSRNVDDNIRPEEPGNPSYIDLEIVVRDKNNRHLKNAAISLVSIGSPEEKETDDKGFVVFRIQKVKNAEITVSKEGYISKNINLNLDNEEGKVRIIELTEIPYGEETSSDENDEVSEGSQGTKNPATIKQIKWDTAASGPKKPGSLDLRGRLDQTFKFYCPPNGQIRYNVWGIDNYADFSSICSAAVHASIINTINGGEVIIKITPGQDSYDGIDRNGVKSKSRGAWGGSFTFVSPNS